MKTSIIFARLLSVRGLSLAALAAAIMLALFLAANPAGAIGGDGEDVPTHATVGGGSGGTQLTIECKWELPDMSPDDTGMTYSATTPAGTIYDDTPSVAADAPACDPANQATAAPYRHHMMGILPNVDDKPIERQYEKWVSIETPAVGNIKDVHWNVWEPYVPGQPGGANCTDPVTLSTDSSSGAAQYCFKYQHHATPSLGAPTTSNPLQFWHSSQGNCSALQAMDPMFAAAVATGQMTQAEADYVQAQCFENKATFRVQETISKEQPCGEYRVEVVAVNEVGARFTNVNFFDVLCFYYLATDFTSVDWGQISSTTPSNVAGDECFLGTDPNDDLNCPPARPTVRNQGNWNLIVRVHYDPLVCDNDPAPGCVPTKQITEFDLKFRAAYLAPELIDEIPQIFASSWACFVDHPLVHDQDGKIDFSVHPNGAIAGEYSGAVQIMAATSCQTGDIIPGA